MRAVTPRARSTTRSVSVSWRAGVLLILTLLFSGLLEARKYYDDDPIQKEPPPVSAEKVSPHQLSDYYDYFLQTFGKPGEAQPENKTEPADLIPALAVNTLGEVPDSAWFTNRIGSRPLSIEELVRGPGRAKGPSMEDPWLIIAAKTEGVTPGFTVQDSAGRVYFLKFDPVTNPEMTTGADAVGSAFFHALGYNVPENYLVEFDEDQFVIKEGTTVQPLGDKERPMEESDIADILRRVPRTAQGRFRGIASYVLAGKPLGEFQYHGVRPDDPNDIVRHEHRRDLRGLFVFCAWLGHDDSRSINTLDMLVEENGVKYVKHHLIDFGSILGSASVYANSSRSGNEYLFAFKPAALQVLTLGFYVPRWARLKYKMYPSVGRFDYRVFEPEKWKPEYRNPAFENRLPDDTFWAAKKAMAFTDEQIRALVGVGEYSDREAEAWLVECLIKRRDIIGKTYFTKVLPLDNFRVLENALKFEDLAVKYGFIQSRKYDVAWSRCDNNSDGHVSIPDATSFALPAEVRNAAAGEYFTARIRGGAKTDTVTVHVRKKNRSFEVVGIDRTW